MPDPKFLILDSDGQQLMACDQFGDQGDMLAATEFPIVPQNCFCDVPLINCGQILIDECLDFVLLPNPMINTGFFPAVFDCPYTSRVHLAFPLTNEGSIGAANPDSYIGIWCGGSPPQCLNPGPPFGASIGTWVLTTGGICTDFPTVNFNIPLYSNTDDAMTAGCDVTANECGIYTAFLKCFPGIENIQNSYWQLFTRCITGGPCLTTVCVFYKWDTGTENAICPTSSSVFSIDQSFFPGNCGCGSPILVNDHNLSGLNFFN